MYYSSSQFNISIQDLSTTEITFTAECFRNNTYGTVSELKYIFYEIKIEKGR